MNSFRIFLCLVLLGIPSLSAADSSRAGWGGLWRVVQQTQSGPEVFYLYIDPDSGRPSFYASQWAPLTFTGWELSESQASWNWIVKGMNVQFELKRQGEQFDGQWRLTHPQYQTAGKTEGRRVVTAAGWSPFLGARRIRQGVRVDLAAHLLERSPSEAAAFDRFWKDHVEPDFYPLIDGAPGAQSVQAFLKQAETPDRITRVSQALRDIESGFQRLTTSFPLAQNVVTLPYGPAEVRGLLLGDEFFLFVGVTIADGLSRRELRRRLVEQMSRETWPSLPNAGLRIFRAGLGPFFVQRLGFASSEEEVFGMTAGQLAGAREEIKGIRGLFELQGSKINPELEKVFGYDFLRVLTQRYSAAQILELGDSAIQSEFRAYSSRLGVR